MQTFWYMAMQGGARRGIGPRWTGLVILHASEDAKKKGEKEKGRGWGEMGAGEGGVVLPPLSLKTEK